MPFKVGAPLSKETLILLTDRFSIHYVTGGKIGEFFRYSITRIDPCALPSQSFILFYTLSQLSSIVNQIKSTGTFTKKHLHVINGALGVVCVVVVVVVVVVRHAISQRILNRFEKFFLQQTRIGLPNKLALERDSQYRTEWNDGIKT